MKGNSFEMSAFNGEHVWTQHQIDLAFAHRVLVEIGGNVYDEITEYDVENHVKTTAARWNIRPVRLLVATGLRYNDILDTIRWEMCHGAGCKGPRKTRVESASPVPSDMSFLSTDSLPEVTDAVYDVKTVHRTRYVTDDRDVFIAFKGRARSGELLYAATVHQKSEPNSRMTSDQVSAHWETADARLSKCPIPMVVNGNLLRDQLKRTAQHREDLTITILDNIFERRGGRIQHCSNSSAGWVTSL